MRTNLSIYTLLAFAMLLGCKSETQDSLSSSSSVTSPDIGELAVDFIDQSVLDQEQKVSMSAIDPNVGGVYFGELEIVAYNYRPNQEIQRWEPNNGFNGEDWSYWILLQSGADKSRDNVLKPNERLDMSALSTKFNPPEDKEFIKNVGIFSIDFFEVSVYRPGLIYNNAFYGANVSNFDPLYKYPDWSQIAQYKSNPGIGGFAGFPGHGSASDLTQRVSEFSVVFARDDWFPEPVLVYFSDRNTIGGTSKSLTSDQSAVLLSLVSQNTQRRNFEHFIIVPYSRKAIAMKRERVGSDGAKTSLKAQVSFNLNDIIEAGATFTGDSSVIKFKRDADNVPLGISLSFKDNK